MSAEAVGSRVERLRALAANLGLLVRGADHQDEGWHIVDPTIDDKVYAFAFTKPHTFSLDDVERILLQRTAAAEQRSSDLLE